MENFKTTRIGIAGDWHGDIPWIIAALKQFKKEGITEIYHVGDFGFWPGRDGQKFLKTVTRQLALYGQQIYVTPGNHEDYPQMNAVDVSVDGLAWITDRIAIMPRGFRWAVGETTFVSLGGAPSINYEDLAAGISWWPEEAVTMGDVYRLGEGGHADIMITHDAPNGIPLLDALMSANRKDWSANGLQYADQGRSLMDQAVSIVKPEILFHGHYHYDYIQDVILKDWDGEFSMKAVGTGRNRRQNNIMVFDVETRSMEWLVLDRMWVPDPALAGH